MTRRTALLTIVVVLALLPVGCGWLSGRSEPPPDVGVREGRLSDCPSSPNCVSSLEDGDQYVKPLVFEGRWDQFLGRLEERVRSMDGATVVTREGRYLHVEFRTPLLGFVDDVEFLVDVDSSRVHVRSASRIGYSDLGTNRERVEAIRDLLRGDEAYAPDGESVEKVVR